MPNSLDTIAFGKVQYDVAWIITQGQLVITQIFKQSHPVPLHHESKTFKEVAAEITEYLKSLGIPRPAKL